MADGIKGRLLQDSAYGIAGREVNVSPSIAKRLVAQGAAEEIRDVDTSDDGIVVRLLRDSEYGAAGRAVRVSTTHAQRLIERGHAEAA